MRRKKINYFVYIITFIFITLVLTGCSNNRVIQKYVYNDQNYQMGNMAFDSNIVEIDVDWIIGDVIIQKSNNEELIIREEIDVNTPDEYKMRYASNNNVLDIKFCKSMDLLDHEFKVKKLYIFIPTRLSNIKIEVESESSNILLDDFKCGYIEINNVSGNIDMENVTASNVSLESVSGNIILFNNSITELDVETVSGDMGITFDTFPIEFEADSVSGNIKIYLKETDSMLIKFETTSGTFNSKLDYQKYNGQYNFNNGTILYEIETVSGDLKIIKK